MTTSGTSTFNLDLNNLVEEAFERCGAELRTGYDMRTARRSLNLLTIEWANRGINLWTIDQGSIALTQGTGTYNLPIDTIDLLDSVIRTGTGTNQNDINITLPVHSEHPRMSNLAIDTQSAPLWILRVLPSNPPMILSSAPQRDTLGHSRYALLGHTSCTHRSPFDIPT